jgi:cell division protease FtsH
MAPNKRNKEAKRQNNKQIQPSASPTKTIIIFSESIGINNATNWYYNAPATLYILNSTFEVFMDARLIRNFLILMIVSIVVFLLYNIWQLENRPKNPISYNSFIKMLDKNEIKSLSMTGGEITGYDNFNQTFSTFSPAPQELTPELIAKNIEFSAKPIPEKNNFWSSTFPIIILMICWIFYSSRKQKKKSDFGKKSDLGKGMGHSVTFDDVAGIKEAKEELVEIVDFLKKPDAYTRLGGKIPKGILLQGPPGTGKTLMAKAIAGEAGVPFFSISGSDFVEMFVGVGASRVRELFKNAKKTAPCIIFIDEIDAVGRHRGAAEGSGGTDEREQTLNALLVEMDGFQSGETVILIAATNRPDILDPALLRPGRFDRQVTILPPDVKGREKILQVFSKKVKMSESVDLKVMARSTPGSSGADLANMVNEAALIAAKLRKNAIELADLESAKDKILMGTERKGLVISENERKTIAYHEAGHAILARVLPETDPLHKITIIPRGRAMGMTQQTPLDDRHSYSMIYLTNRVKILLGGRAAEEIVFKQYTTGAANDLQNATEIANKMICEWGMSEVLGPLAYSKADESFLGGTSIKRAYGEETAKAIDTEIKRLVIECYKDAVSILTERIEFLHKLAEVLLIHETIDAEEVEIIVNCPKLNESYIFDQD